MQNEDLVYAVVYLSRFQPYLYGAAYMREASIFFPFRQAFRRLELEKHWWHRLCVVMFSAMLLGAAAFTAWVTYSVFAPQVAILPDIQAAPVYLDPATGEPITQPATLPPDDLVPIPANGPSKKQTNKPPDEQVDISAGLVPKQLSTIEYDALAKKFGGVPVQPMIDPQHAVHQIPMDKVIDALEAGDQRVVDMYDPKGNRGWIPEDKVQAAIKAGFKIAKPVTPDFSKAQPLNKSIQMPDGSTSHFAGTVSDDAIKSQWNHAKTAQTWKAICWAGLFTTTVALFVNYFLQGAYRALLFVIFGSKIQAA